MTTPTFHEATDAAGRWLGPDGIEYACEADYRDSWGLLDEACRKLEAANAEVA